MRKVEKWGNYLLTEKSVRIPINPNIGLVVYNEYRTYAFEVTNTSYSTSPIYSRNVAKNINQLIYNSSRGSYPSSL
jgi:hypothetical protein